MSDSLILFTASAKDRKRKRRIHFFEDYFKQIVVGKPMTSEELMSEMLNQTMQLH